MYRKELILTTTGVKLIYLDSTLILAGILRDKTMADKLMLYKFKQYKFEPTHQDFIQIPNVYKPINERMCLLTFSICKNSSPKYSLNFRGKHY